MNLLVDSLVWKSGGVEARLSSTGVLNVRLLCFLHTQLNTKILLADIKLVKAT